MNQQLFDSIETIVREAGRIVKNAHAGSDQIEKKEGLANFVTEYDVKVQEYLIGEFQKLIPDAAYFGEEATDGNKQQASADGYTFYIDPIDGTTNFMFDYNFSCISVGLAYQKQMVAGFVYNPYVDEMFTAVRGQGSFMNGQPIHAENLGIGEGIVAFGCARYNEANMDLLFDTVKEIFWNSLSIRSGGSAALDLCRVAANRNVGFLEFKLQPYDYAAASLIVEEAGGVIAQVDGSPIDMEAPCSVLAGTPKACEEIRAILEKKRGALK